MYKVLVLVVSQHGSLNAAEVIKGPITYIVNLSLKSGIFPNEMKLAKVIPLHKKKGRLDAGNYRPVSILSVVSKVFEKKSFSLASAYHILQTPVLFIYKIILESKLPLATSPTWFYWTSRRLSTVLTTKSCVINCPLWKFNLRTGSARTFLIESRLLI